MKNENLFESMEFIDDSYLEKSEKKPFAWKKWTAVAASVCLIMISVYAISEISNPMSNPNYEDDPILEDVNNAPNSQLEGPEFPDNSEVITPNAPDAPTPAPDPNPNNTIQRPDDPIQREDPPTEFPEPNILRPGDEGYSYPEPPLTEVPELPEFLFDAVYNDTDNVVSAAMPNIPAYFVETLDRNKLLYLQLSFAPDWIVTSGSAGFDQDGALVDIRLSTPTQVPDTEIHISLSQRIPVCDYIFSTEAETSVIGNVEVEMYRWVRSEESVFLQADGVFDGVNISISVETDAENEAVVRNNLETVVYLYANYFCIESLGNITPDEIPEYINESLTLAEAYANEEFGDFMPKTIPEGFVLESSYRYKNYMLDYLSGLWTKGYAQISWQISYMTEEDENRLTSVETVENYDLSLYPIPMSQSVPDELREIVNNPIFDISELTLDVIYARSRLSGDAGDVDGYRTNFSVRCGDILIKISTKGVSPEWIYQALKFN